MSGSESSPGTVRLREGSADWLPPVVLAVAAGHELAYNNAGPWLWLLAQGLVWALVFRRRWPEPVLATTLALTVLCWATTDTLLVAHLGVFVALHAVARHVGPPRAVAALVVVEVAAVATAFGFAPAGSVNDGVVLLTGVTVAAYLLGTSQRAVHRSLAALGERTDELEREREKNAEMAAAAERTRIAREVHDVVAHSVSVMIALSEGAAATPDRDEARRTMRQVASTGREALTELRGVLAVLQPDDAITRRPTPSLQSLTDLVADVCDAGLDVRLSITPGQEALSTLAPGLQATAYRIVQESLTNTLKHAARAQHAHVSVVRGPDEVTIRVEDDGGLKPDSETPAVVGAAGVGGRGLRGMRERAEAFGGLVTAGPVATGWVVSCILPVAADQR